MIGKRLGAFVPPGQVPEVWAGVTSVFRDYGYRRLRHRARLKFLMADWGPERFREVLERDYLGYALADGPAPKAPGSGRRDHVGVHQQRDGRYYVGFAPRVGRMSADSLALVAGLAGRVRQRAGPDHHRAEDGDPRRPGGTDRPALAAELGAADLPVTPSVFRRHTMACTGIEFCKLAIVETKARASDLIAELERRLPDFTEPITINVNGCPNSCARIQTADIGLKGTLVTAARRRAGGRIPGPPGRQPGRRGRGKLGLRPEDQGAEDHRRRATRLRGAGAAPLRLRPGCRARRSPPGPAGPARRTSRSDASRRMPFRQSGQSRSTAPTAAKKTWSRRKRTASGVAAAASRSFRLRFAGTGVDPVSRDVIRRVPEAAGPGRRTDSRRPARLEEAIRMERLASRGGRRPWPDAPAEDVVRWATDTFGDRICITSSMTDAVIIHLVSQVRAGHRRDLPGHRLPLRGDDRHQGRGVRRLPGQRDQRHAVPDRGRAGRRRSGPGCTAATPICAATCARSSRWSGRSSPTTPGSPGSARRRPTPAATPASCSGTPGGRW